MVSSHLGSDRNQKDLQPLSFQPLLVECEKERQLEIDHSTDFVNYLTIAYAKILNPEADDNSQKEVSVGNSERNDFHWSFPVRLMCNETGTRMTTSLTIEDKENEKYEAICVSGIVKGGVTYFTVQIDTAPVCFIQNQCSFPLYFGQTLMNLTLKSK